MKKEVRIMRTHCLGLLVGCGAAAASLSLSACGSETQDINPPSAAEATVEDAGAQFEVGNTINYGSLGTTAEVDCQDGKSLNVAGSSNDLTVKGTCSSVTIGGAGNEISFEKIEGELDVIGFNNTVTYQSGDPQVDDLGSNNKINKV